MRATKLASTALVPRCRRILVSEKQRGNWRPESTSQKPFGPYYIRGQKGETVPSAEVISNGRTGTAKERPKETLSLEERIRQRAYELWGGAGAPLEAELPPLRRISNVLGGDFLTNIALNSRSASARPLSVSTTDFALLTGSSTNSFSCRRFSESHSKHFQALQPSCSVR